METRRTASPTRSRWSLFRPQPGTPGSSLAPPPSSAPSESAEFAARALLRRYGVLFRALLEKERLPVPWRDLARACRTLELRGEIRGGRFVTGFAGEQFALPEAVTLLRSMKKRAPSVLPELASADPLALDETLTPGLRGAAPSGQGVAQVDRS